jgi:hypothetical protein
MLTNHSKIVVPPECGFIVWLYERYREWSPEDAADPVYRSQYLDDLASCKKFDTWSLNKSHLEIVLAQQLPADYAALSATIYMAFAEQQGKRAMVWGDKNNFYTNYLPTLEAIYPEARFIHIVRDGRDVACSYREVMQSGSTSPYAPNLATDVNEIAIEWSANVLRVDKFLSDIAASRRLLIRYEDMVSDTKNVVEGLCRWLEVPVEDAMLAPHVLNKKMHLEPELTLDWKMRTLEPISADSVGRYRELLPAREQEAFADLAGAALKKYGYELDVG